MTTPIRAAIWARVSKTDQDTENQLLILRELAQVRGFNVVTEYVTEDSAWNGNHRAALNRALEDARHGGYRVLLVWALDRLSREGVEATLSLLRRFDERGAYVVSYEESWLDGAPEMRELLASVYAWVARMESKRRSERVKAGLARRRAQGLPVGRQVGATDLKPRKRSGYVARYERERAEREAAS